MKRGKKSRNRLFQALLPTLGEYSQKTTRALSSLLHQEWGQVIRLAKGLGDEAAAILMWLNLFPLGLVNLERMDVLTSVGPRRPILLVHGYFHNNSIFYVLKRRLYREGWKHVYRINLNTYTLGTDECADVISRKVDDILKATGAERVDIIGHSYGGLCARYYIQALDGADKVGHCICIGTPHQGTHLASFGLGTANLDMQPGSDVLHELNVERKIPGKVEFTNIWSPFDYMVIPIESTIMEGRVRNIKVDHVGHLGLLFSRRVFDYIFLTLSSDSIHRKLEPLPKGKKDKHQNPAEVSYLQAGKSSS